MASCPCSTPAAAAATLVVTDANPSVAPTASVVALAAAMGVIKKVSSSAGTVAGSSTSGSSSESGRSDSANPAGVEQEFSSEPFVRSLSGSRLNAKAPEFVPKGITQSSVSGFGPVATLPIAGVLASQFPEAYVLPSNLDPMPSMVSLSPPVVTAAASPPLVPDFDEAFLAEESSPPQTYTTAHAHGPLPKPIVNEELRARIVKQIEFYFSDQNLPTDNYLMKFIKKDPDGFVPIPVVASFRKIKNLVKNHGLVAAALRSSTLLVVSDDGKKVRRTQPLSEFDLEEVQLRTVVAENLPEDHSVESVEQLFSSVGNVKMVRICQPEAANGANQIAAKFKSDMVVSNKLHALVEFETIEQAEKAVVALTDQGNWRSGLRVRLLLRRTFQSKHGFQQGSFPKGRKVGGEESGGEEEEGVDDKTGEDGCIQNDRSEEFPGNDVAATVDRDSGGKKGKGRGRGRGTTGRGKGQHGGSHHINSNGSRPYQLGTSPQTSHTLTGSEVVGRPPPGPRMPDGTRGFTLGRGKVPIMGSA